jgi:hypothetical protein
MSFQAYIDNIKAKTGKTPEDFRQLAEAKGLLKPGVKAGEIVAWLKEDFGLVHYRTETMCVYVVCHPQAKIALPPPSASI